ncbi:MAG: hypothetical protein A2802_00305 [Candidatus Woykebacteria bacterium RIFCSPHIGHO2_01_FULL_43_29]|uniref:Uncharacterized protein n=1 Tax=Candidatus Woykebacteria bacterium RIFCSPLOWO2_01_FULL_43_14 TaxID=1802605 RepID=A0A1G1WUN7_9BACT|nr:MAG: hypothetical protein A2802_00305 [Candidatus Woykebacteria bacterium RIFCSPHIGHO2_01_FULL_43_29]OGY31434.1 MAG: hypothetical protein A3A61_02285 [Candidatus Woykebacteria bacterium RIFCSPLOWO2_01_FULL_43_14]
MKIGTIRGRHEMPVDRYLVDDREVSPGEDAYNAVFEAAKVHGQSLPVADTVELFYAGLTEATIGALDGYESVGINVVPMRFNVSSGGYESLSRRVNPWVVCQWSKAGEPHPTRLSDAHCKHCGAS